MNMKTAQINSLLDLINNTKNTKTKTKSTDFLFQLLKNINDKNLIKELIEKSNLSQKEKSKLLKKFNLANNELLFKNHIKPFSEKISNINSAINKNNKTSNKTTLTKIYLDKNTPTLNLKQKTKKSDFSDKSIVNLLLQENKKNNNEISKYPLLPHPQQYNIVKEIKQIMKSLSYQNKTLQTLVSLKEFKNATNIKDLINLTKKFHLNLEKIIFQKEPLKENIETKPPEPLFSKINPKIKKFVKSGEKVSQKTGLNKISLNKLINKPQITEKSFKLKTNTQKSSNKKQKEQTNNENSALNIATHSEVKQKIISSKQSLKHFASNLKEAIENYKPPVTKLTLQLHPKEIGKVEVVIKQRGENLQVQISTNNQTTINFLTSQQAELKNSLVNMGFTNINMNFNSNEQNKKQNHQQKQNNYQNTKNDENEELIIDFTYKYA